MKPAAGIKGISGKALVKSSLALAFLVQTAGLLGVYFLPE